MITGAVWVLLHYDPVRWDQLNVNLIYLKTNHRPKKQADCYLFSRGLHFSYKLLYYNTTFHTDIFCVFRLESNTNSLPSSSVSSVGTPESISSVDSPSSFSFTAPDSPSCDQPMRDVSKVDQNLAWFLFFCNFISYVYV